MENKKGFFPMFVDISKKKIVVVGAGKIASRRIKTLLLFADDILVIAPEVKEEILLMERDGLVQVQKKMYDREDLYDAQIVIAATNDLPLNNEIFSVCRCMGILVNVASDKSKCDFHFPGVVKKEEIVIGIHAGGSNHRRAKEVREELEEFLKKTITIGSRQSRLAVVQSEMVMNYLKKRCPDREIQMLTMKTTGDIILDRTLDKIGGKGLFVKELDKALLEKRSDLSVHSLKDMPMELQEELPIVAFSKREDPRDVLILPKGERTYRGDKPIGCSSLRRKLQLKELFPQAEFKDVRGNVLTRLQKLDRGEYGALILAAAGMKRLQLENRISRYFEPEEMIPAAGQGILAIQGRKDEDYSYMDEFSDKAGTYAALAERAFVRYLDGGCSSPIAAHAVVSDKKITLRGLYYNEESRKYCKGTQAGDVDHAEELGITLAKILKKQI